MSEVQNISTSAAGTDLTAAGTGLTAAGTSLTAAGSTTEHILEGSRRCKRCNHSKRDSHVSSDADSNHNTCSFLCIHVPRRSDGMCCVRHYCVQNSDSFRQKNISLESIPSAEAATTRAGNEGRGDAGETTKHVELGSAVESSSTAVCARSHAVSEEAGVGHHAAAGNPGSKGHCEGDEDDEESSNSATSMLRNRKKPRSRLKKFVTSLLSLSSSSSDEEH